MNWKKKLKAMFEMMPSEEAFVEEEAKNCGYEKIEAFNAIESLIEDTVASHDADLVKKMEDQQERLRMGIKKMSSKIIKGLKEKTGRFADEKYRKRTKLHQGEEHRKINARLKEIYRCIQIVKEGK